MGGWDAELMLGAMRSLLGNVLKLNCGDHHHITVNLIKIIGLGTEIGLCMVCNILKI